MIRTIKATIDGQTIDVSDGTTILQACQDLSIEVPVFCYHPRLAIAGNCRMCLVEVEKMGKPVASCAMPLADGMVVHTKSPMAQKAQKGALEFLLINHPLDCPICDQGGECDLQDITMSYGCGSSRFDMNKRAVPEKYMGPLIKTMMNRCIHCTRCVRFANEIAGVPEVGAIHRGEHTEITTLENAVSSELSGNLIDICPVGALTNKPYAFHGRPWELKKTDGIDVMDAVGSNIRIDTRGNKVMRILPRVNEAINEEWISDRTRFACDGLSNQRLDRPYRRVDGKLMPCTWDEAFETIREKLIPLKGTEIAGLAGDFVDMEGAFALRFLLDVLESPHRDCRQDGAVYSDTTLNRSHYCFNTTIAGLEQADLILLVGTNPRHEAALINARIRKRHLMGNLAVGLIGDPVDLTYPYDHVGFSVEALADLVSGTHAFSSTLKAAKFPAIILGQASFKIPGGLSLVQSLLDTYPAFIQPEIWNGYNVLHYAAGRVGALDAGFLPAPGGLSTMGILDGCKSGTIKVVFAHGVDEIPTAEFGDAFIIYSGHHGDQGAHRADVILPSAAYTEKDAIYVNTEGRAQESFAALSPPGEARVDWTIFRALSDVMEKPLAFHSLASLRQHMLAGCPAVASMGEIIPSIWTSLVQKGQSIAVPKGAFDYPIKNPYMTCSISRHSKTMATCVQEILK